MFSQNNVFRPAINVMIDGALRINCLFIYLM